MSTSEAPTDTAAPEKHLAADGLSGVLAGTFNSFLDTAFAQNVGLVQVTRVRSRYVVTVAGIILVLLGLIPKLGEIIAAISSSAAPSPPRWSSSSC